MRRLLDTAVLRAALPARNRYDARALARPDRHPALTTLTVLEVLYCTGMRVGEFAAVRLPDLNMGEGIITVNGKGNRQRRVFLPEAGVIRLVGGLYLDARAQHSPGHDTLLISPGDDSAPAVAGGGSGRSGLPVPPHHPPYAAPHGGNALGGIRRGHPLRPTPAGPSQHQHDGGLHTGERHQFEGCDCGGERGRKGMIIPSYQFVLNKKRIF